MIAKSNAKADETEDDEIEVMLETDYIGEGIGLTTIGLGESFDPALMRGLAEIGGGNHYFLENPRSVEEVFVEEIEYFVTPIASNLRIELQVETNRDNVDFDGCSTTSIPRFGSASVRYAYQP